MELQERNKQIALMLGWKITDGIISYIPEESSFKHKEGYSADGFLQFDSDWNWIMEAVVHITSLGWNWEMIDFNGTVKEENCFSCSIFNLDLDKPYNKIKQVSSKPIEAVFIVVSDFAKSYNEN